MPRRMQKHAATFLRLAALWLLAGALFKLLMGSPKDLPPSVLSFARGIELNADLTLRLAVAIELVIGVLALLRPKLAWLPITLQFIVFEAILLQMVLGGDASCGCFGSQITVPPQVMLGIDSVVLLCLLLSKPWHQAPAPSPGLPTVLVLLLCGAAPWLVIPPTVDVPIVLTNVSASFNAFQTFWRPEKTGSRRPWPCAMRTWASAQRRHPQWPCTMATVAKGVVAEGALLRGAHWCDGNAFRKLFWGYLPVSWRFSSSALREHFWEFLPVSLGISLQLFFHGLLHSSDRFFPDFFPQSAVSALPGAWAA